MKRNLTNLFLNTPFTNVQRGENANGDGFLTVQGYAYVNSTVPGDKWDITRSAMEAATADYMKWANVRVMHRAEAVGTCQSVEWDERGALITCQIVDADAILKIEQGVYKGFSIGVRPEEVLRGTNQVIKVTWFENSIVDRPADADCPFFTRAEGSDDELEVTEVDPGESKEDEGGEASEGTEEVVPVEIPTEEAPAESGIEVDLAPEVSAEETPAVEDVPRVDTSKFLTNMMEYMCSIVPDEAARGAFMHELSEAMLRSFIYRTTEELSYILMEIHRNDVGDRGAEYDLVMNDVAAFLRAVVVDRVFPNISNSEPEERFESSDSMLVSMRAHTDNLTAELAREQLSSKEITQRLEGANKEIEALRVEIEQLKAQPRKKEDPVVFASNDPSRRAPLTKPGQSVNGLPPEEVAQRLKLISEELTELESKRFTDLQEANAHQSRISRLKHEMYLLTNLK